MGWRLMSAQSGTLKSGHPLQGQVFDVRTGSGAKASKTKGCVHVVEDDLDIAMALEFMLRANGLEVVVSNSGTALLEKLGRGQQATVLMDLRLPDVSGLDLLVTLRTQFPNLPVIVMTGYGQVQMAVKAMKMGALDFLEKPIDEKELIDLLARAFALLQPSEDERARALLAELTAREMETLSKIVKGLTSKQAAQQLGISPRTVDVHRASILQKLGAPTTVAALALLRQLEPMQYQLLTDDPQMLYMQTQHRIIFG